MKNITKGEEKDGRKMNEMETMRNVLETVQFFQKMRSVAHERGM